MIVILLDLLFNVILPFRKHITEDEITKNIKSLKKTEWFPNYLDNYSYKQFIIHDREMRTAIGKFNAKKLNKNPNRKKYKRKIDRILQSKKVIVNQ